MSKLEEIVAIFESESKGKTPVAIIQNGTTPQEKVGIGTIETIREVVAENKLSSPAIIVIGEVVGDSKKSKRFYKELRSTHNKMLLYGKE
jgi:uroporphyrin-III C-methyltransferase